MLLGLHVNVRVTVRVSEVERVRWAVRVPVAEGLPLGVRLGVLDRGVAVTESEGLAWVAVRVGLPLGRSDSVTVTDGVNVDDLRSGRTGRGARERHCGWGQGGACLTAGPLKHTVGPSGPIKVPEGVAALHADCVQATHPGTRRLQVR